MHDAAVMVEHASCFTIVERILCTELGGCCKAANKACFLTVNQDMSTAVPGPSSTLNKAKQRYDHCDMSHIVYNVLKPPATDDELWIYRTIWVVRHETRFI